MRISHRYKFIFISKPRCASTMIRQALNPYSDIFSSSQPPYHHHTTALELKLHFDEQAWNWNDYFSFTTVRNPWDMMVSCYFRFKPDVNMIFNFESERNGIAYQVDNLATFKDWIHKGKTHHRLLNANGELIRNVWVDGFSKLTLSNTINDINGKSLVNKILRVEDIDNELEQVLSDLGINIPGELIRLNTTIRKDYHYYYDTSTKKIIEEQFISDIEYGKYSF